MAKIVIQKKIRDFKKVIKVDSDKSLSIRSLLIGSQSFGLCKINNFESIFPEKDLCGDNAAMIALVGLKKFKKKKFDKLSFSADPRWQLDKDAKFLKGSGVKL